MKKILFALFAILFSSAAIQAEVLILEGDKFIKDVQIIANQSGEIVFKHDGEYHQINQKKIVNVAEQVPKELSPVNAEELSGYKDKYLPLPATVSEQISEETLKSDEQETKWETLEEVPEPDLEAEEQTEPGTLQPLTPGKTVKIYFHSGKSVKGLLKSWTDEEVILQGKDGEYVVELTDVKDAKYYISPDDIGKTDLIAYPAPKKMLSEEEIKEQENIDKLEEITEIINNYENARKTQQVLGFVTLLLGVGLVFESEASRSSGNRSEYTADIQSIAGLASAMLGGSLLAAGAGTTHQIEKLEKEKNEIQVQQEINSQYGGVKITWQF